MCFNGGRKLWALNWPLGTPSFISSVKKKRQLLGTHFCINAAGDARFSRPKCQSSRKLIDLGVVDYGVVWAWM